MAQKDKNNSPFTLLMLIESQSRRLTPAYYRHLQQEYNHSLQLDIEIEHTTSNVYGIDKHGIGCIAPTFMKHKTVKPEVIVKTGS